VRYVNTYFAGMGIATDINVVGICVFLITRENLQKDILIMNSETVLLLSSNRKKGLLDVLQNIGLEPLLRENIQGILEKLRHENYAAIVVDSRNANIDVLELVLNVRDIDGQIPVVVLGKLNDQAVRRTLESQKQATVIENTRDWKKLEEDLAQIMTDIEINND
jgi:DNA-binding NtrC family response regulator